MPRTCQPILLAASLALAACGGVEIVRLKPGQSVDKYFAARNAPPATPAPLVAAERKPMAPPVEPSLPVQDNVGAVADAFTRGKLALQAGRDAEAMKAFEETVKLDPNFVDAWTNLAYLYEKVGQSKKAVEAFRRAKDAAIPGSAAN